MSAPWCTTAEGHPGKSKLHSVDTHPRCHGGICKGTIDFDRADEPKLNLTPDGDPIVQAHERWRIRPRYSWGGGREKRRTALLIRTWRWS